MPKPEPTRVGWPSRISLGVWGGTLWILVGALPSLFLGFEDSQKSMAWSVVIGIILPALTLFFAIWKRHPTTALSIFPGTLLLAIVWSPEITSSRIYGIWQFFTVVIVGGIYFRSALYIQQDSNPILFQTQALATKPPKPPLAWAHVLVSAALLLGSIIWGVFILPIPAEPGGEIHSNTAITTLLIGLITWLAALFALQVPAWRTYREQRLGASATFGVELRELWREMRPRRGGLATAVMLVFIAFLLVGVSRWV